MRIKSYLTLSLASLLLLSGCATVKQDMGKKEVLCPLTGVVAGGAVGAGVSSAGLLAPAGALVGGLLADHLCGNEMADQDGDGVQDSQDLCPGTLAGLTVNGDGCLLDSDSDGVYDEQDKCPGTPEGALVDATGCVKDADMDGVSDAVDECPETPKGVIVNEKGCAKDSDMDGVVDSLDQCPGTPANTNVDVKGCKLPVFVVADQCAPYVTIENNYFISAKPVLFAFASAEVSGEGKKILQCIVNAAKGTLSNLEVAGYTDSVGSAGANNRLSKRRAENVYAILVKKGFDKSKLKVVGYGMTDPVGDNATASGSAQNRRVEIRPVY